MKRTIFPLLSFLLLFFSYNKVSAQPGALDMSFGIGGLVNTPLNTNYDVPKCSAIQTDGKILMGGYAYFDTVSSMIGFALMRFNSNGSSDLSFNGNGKLVTVFPGNTHCFANAIAIQPDNKIILAGYSSVGNINTIAMARYFANGIVDSSFGNSGFVNTYVHTYDDRCNAIHLQNDGKIILVGTTRDLMNNTHFVIARYDSTGALDTTFSNIGINIITFSGNDAQAYSVTELDGKYYVFGTATLLSISYFALARLSSDGSIDSSFGTNGTTTYAPGNGFLNSGLKIIAQPDKKLLLYGTSKISGRNKLTILRLDTTASYLDPGFGVNGVAIADYSYYSFGATDFTLQSDGKIVATGNLANIPSYDFALSRFKSNGEADSTFGINGNVITSFGSNNDFPCAVNIQSDGKIVIAGKTSSIINSSTTFALARYYGDASVGIPNIAESPAEISIYPNPLTNELNIRLSDDVPAEITLYDITFGKQVQKSFTRTTSLNTEGLSNGIYIYQIRNAIGILKNGKVVKE